MFQPVSFPDTMEPLVRWIEEMPPERSVEETVKRLRAGESVTRLATAAALAACRSTELPFVHHGGPLHPVAALIAVRGTQERMPEEERWLPLIQDVALLSRHLHDRGSAPYVMPAMEPRGEKDVGETVAAFHHALRRNVPSAAEQHFLWLLENAPRETALEALLRVAVGNYRFDEHKLILAVNTIRLLDWIGWEWAPTLLRVAVRYNFMPSVWSERSSGVSMECQAQKVESLAQSFDAHAPKPASAPESEKDAVAGLRRTCGDASAEEIPGAVAEVLAAGLSLEGAAEAISLAASDLFVNAETTNPMGIHFMTGANAVRWVCRHFPALGPRALLSWALGPETRGIQQAPRAPLPAKHGDVLQLAEAVAAHDAQSAAAIALSMAERGKGAKLLSLLAPLAAGDDTTELHLLKHHQAMAEEWQAARSEGSGTHLAAQAKQVALSPDEWSPTHLRARAALGINR